MAGDSAITAVKAVRNSYAVASAAGKIAHDTGYAYLDVSTMDGSKVLFLVNVVGTDTNTSLTILDGGSTSTPLLYSGSAQGNLTIETTATLAQYLIGPLETARFKDSNGYIRFQADSADTTDMYVKAFLIP
jgi:hypothetical protein